MVDKVIVYDLEEFYNTPFGKKLSENGFEMETSQTVDSKKIIVPINGGGQGKVYKATKANNKYAIKILFTKKVKSQDIEVSSQEDFLEDYKGFINEVHKTLAGTKKFNPYTMKSSNYFYEENNEYKYALIVFPFIDTTLAEQMKATSLFEEDEQSNKLVLIRIIKDICSGMMVCDKENIVHLDIKPENVFYDSEKYIIGDFGIAQKKGTYFRPKGCSWEYAAPEYKRRIINIGKEISEQKNYKDEDVLIKARTTLDTFSIGVILFALSLQLYDRDSLANGEMPKKWWEKREELLEKINDKKLKEIIKKATDSDRKKRYASAEKLKEAIEDYEEDILSPNVDKPSKTLKITRIFKRPS